MTRTRLTANIAAPHCEDQPHITTATYFGGDPFDRAQGVDVDANIYFIMNTSSAKLPTLAPGDKKPFQPDKAGTKKGHDASDAYVGKLSDTDLGDLSRWHGVRGNRGCRRGSSRQYSYQRQYVFLRPANDCRSPTNGVPRYVGWLVQHSFARPHRAQVFNTFRRQ